MRDEALCSTSKKFCFFKSIFARLVSGHPPAPILHCSWSVTARRRQPGLTNLGNTQISFPVRYRQLGIQTRPISCWNRLFSTDSAHLGVSFDCYAFHHNHALANYAIRKPPNGHLIIHPSSHTSNGSSLRSLNMPTLLCSKYKTLATTLCRPYTSSAQALS